MASITKRQDSPYWRAQVRRRGYEPISRTFDTKAQAEIWARSVENEMDRGVYFDRAESERTTLADALERYGREILPEKRHPAQEHHRINRWLDYTLTKRSLANLRGADFAAYRDARRDAGRAENTIRLELALISHVSEVARKEWGMEALTNPLNNIRKPSGSKARDPVVARQHPAKVLRVPLRQSRRSHGRSPRHPVAGHRIACLVPALPA